MVKQRVVQYDWKSTTKVILGGHATGGATIGTCSIKPYHISKLVSLLCSNACWLEDPRDEMRTIKVE